MRGRVIVTVMLVVVVVMVVVEVVGHRQVGLGLPTV